MTQAAWASAGLIFKCFSRYMWGWSFSWWLLMSPIIHMSFILSYAYPQRQGVSLIYEINTADYLTTIIFFNTLVQDPFLYQLSTVSESHMLFDAVFCINIRWNILFQLKAPFLLRMMDYDKLQTSFTFMYNHVMLIFNAYAASNIVKLQ